MGIRPTTKYDDCGCVGLDFEFKFALGQAKIGGDAAEKNGKHVVSNSAVGNFEQLSFSNSRDHVLLDTRRLATRYVTSRFGLCENCVFENGQPI